MMEIGSLFTEILKNRLADTKFSTTNRFVATNVQISVIQVSENNLSSMRENK